MKINSETIFYVSIIIIVLWAIIMLSNIDAKIKQIASEIVIISPIPPIP